MNKTKIITITLLGLLAIQALFLIFEVAIKTTSISPFLYAILFFVAISFLKKLNIGAQKTDAVAVKKDGLLKKMLNLSVLGSIIGASKELLQNKNLEKQSDPESGVEK